jgi:hypothetical protein
MGPFRPLEKLFFEQSGTADKNSKKNLNVAHSMFCG